jgi:hypothetical protein
VPFKYMVFTSLLIDANLREFNVDILVQVNVVLFLRCRCTFAHHFVKVRRLKSLLKKKAAAEDGGELSPSKRSVRFVQH